MDKSGLGKVPNFEPDEEFKNMLENLFAKKEEPKEEAPQKKVSNKKPEEKSDKRPKHRVRIPEPPAQSEEEQKVALGFSHKEMAIICDAFYKFTEEAGDTVIFGYLYPQIEELVSYFEDMDVILENEIDQEKLTSYGLTDFEKYRKIRARILNDIYKKYGKSK